MSAVVPFPVGRCRVAYPDRNRTRQAAIAPQSKQRAAEERPVRRVVVGERERASRSLFRFGAATRSDQRTRTSRVKRCVIGQNGNRAVAGSNRVAEAILGERDEREHVRSVGMARIDSLDGTRRAIRGGKIRPTDRFERLRDQRPRTGCRRRRKTCRIERAVTFLVSAAAAARAWRIARRGRLHRNVRN